MTQRNRNMACTLLSFAASPDKMAVLIHALSRS